MYVYVCMASIQFVGYDPFLVRHRNACTSKTRAPARKRKPFGLSTSSMRAHSIVASLLLGASRFYPKLKTSAQGLNQSACYGLNIHSGKNPLFVYYSPYPSLSCWLRDKSTLFNHRKISKFFPLKITILLKPCVCVCEREREREFSW